MKKEQQPDKPDRELYESRSNLMRRIDRAEHREVDGYYVHGHTRTYTAVTRPDALLVFLDKADDELTKMVNYIRLFGAPQLVVAAVGMLRGVQIATNYARSYNVEDTGYTFAMSEVIRTMYRKALTLEAKQQEQQQ